MKKLLFIFSLFFVSLVANTQTIYLDEPFTAGFPFPVASTTLTTGNWTTVNGTIAAGTNRTVISPLVYPATGTKFINSGINNGLYCNYPGLNGNSSISYRTFTASPISTGIVYLSFIYKCTAKGGSNSQVIQLSDVTSSSSGATVWCAGDNTNVRLGVTRSSSATGDVQYYGTAGGAGSLVINSIHLVVLKYDFTTNKAMLYIDPTIGGSDPGDAGANVYDDGTFGTKAAARANFSYIKINGNGASKGYFNISGVRVSDTWANAVAPTITPLVTPSGLSFESVSGTGFTAKWTTVANATSYDVKVYDKSTGYLNTTNTTSLSSVITTGIVEGHTYYFTVTAKGTSPYSDSSESGHSGDIFASSGVTKLTNPSSISAGSITTTGFTAFWTGDAHASSYDVKVYTSPGGVLVGSNHNTSASPLVISSLTPNTSYTFSVTAIGDVTTYSDSDPISSSSFSTTALTKLGTPTAGAATNYTATGFTANWATVANATSYTVVVKQGANTFSTTTGISQATNSLAITGLTANLAYTYTVTAIGDNATAYSDSDPSNSPAAYSSLTPVVSVYDIRPTGFTASWSMTTNATNYTVKLYQGGDLLSTNVVTLSGTGATASPSYIFTGLYEGLPYTFTVTSYDGTTYAESALGSVQTLNPTILENFQDWTAVTTAAAINFSKTLNDGTSGSYSSPLIVVAPAQNVGTVGGAMGNSRPSLGRIQLSSSAAYIQIPLLQSASTLTVKSYGGATGNTFKVQSSPDGTTFTDIAGTTTAITSTVTTAYSVNLGFNSAKYYRIVSNQGSSVYFNDLQVNPYISAIKLTTPSPLSASDNSLSGFTAKWSAVDNALGYYVKVYSGSTLASTTYASGQATSSLVVSGLPTGTTYTYKVIAKGNTTTYLSSDPSTSESATTLGLITPVVGTASSPTSSGFTANWSKVANAVGYDVQVYLGTTLVKTSNVSGQATESLAITGLSMGTSYTYKVIAKGNGTPDLDSSPSTASAIVLTSAVTVASINTDFSDGSWGPTYTSLTQPVSGSYPTYSVNGFDFAITDVYSSSSTGPKGDVHTAYLKLDRGTLGGMITMPTVSSLSQIEIHANNVSTSTARTFTLQQYISGVWTNIGDGSGSGTGLYDLPITQAEMIYIIPITANNTDAKFRILNTSTQAGGINVMQIITRTTSPTLLSVPTVGTADAITRIGFTAQWSTGDANAQGYKVFVYSGTTLVNTYSTLNDNTLRSLEITDLTPNTAYTFKVLSKGDGDASYSDSFLSIASPVTTSNTFNITGTTASSSLTTLDASSAVTVANGATLTIDATKEVNSITIEKGGKLTNNTDVTLTAASLHINSDASGTGTYVDMGTSVITSATVNQWLTAGRNSYFSSPLTTATGSVILGADGLSGNSLWQYNEVNANWLDATSQSTDLTVMRGFVAKKSVSDGVITFTGTLNTGALTPITLYRTDNSNASRGFNLVGNPFPSYVDWTLATKSNLESSIWYRTKTTPAPITLATSYVFDTYNAAGGQHTSLGATTISKLIPPMQAFWVRVSTIGSGTLTFDNNARAHADVSTNSFKAPAAEKSTQEVLKLEVSNGTNKDEAIVYFDANASDNYDAYDSPKMTNANTAIPEIYTTVGNEQLVINGLNSVAANKELALGFNTGASNTFTIKATQVSNFDADTKIYLRDNLLNSEQELTNGASYSFSSDVTNTTTRFKVIFKSTAIATGIGNYNYDDSTLRIFKNENNQITIQRNLSENSMVTICNAIGQKLINTQMSGTSKVIDKQFSAGVYFVTVSNEGNKVTKKVIIK